MALTLKAPKHGAIRRIDTSVIRHETMNQQSIVFADTSWPIWKTLVFAFENVSTEDKDDFLSFYLTNAGKEISFTDYENNTYTGVILTPMLNIEEMANANPDCPNDRGGYSFGFEFGIKP